MVNLDPHYTQSGFVELPLDELKIDPYQPYQVHDLLTGARYLWQGSRNYVELKPTAVRAHLRPTATGAHRARFRLLRLTPKGIGGFSSDERL